MIDWKSKLTSRKFWMSVIGLVSGLLLAFKVDAQTVETISGVIMAGASVIAYVIGEGLADAAGAANNTMPPIVVNSDAFKENLEEENKDVGDV